MFNVDKEKDLREKRNWHALSLLYRQARMYEEEKEIIEIGLLENYDYFKERRKWHNLPLFDRLVPRQALNGPVNHISEELIEQACIITGADKNCYALLVQFLESFFATKIASKIDMFVIDAGFTGEQRHNIKTQYPIKQLVNVKWPFSDIPSPENYHNILVAKAFLPEYSKDYRYYYWCDSDIWIQDENYFLDYLRYADTHQVGISALKGHEEYIKAFSFKDVELTRLYHDTVCHKGYFNSGIYCIDKASGLFEEFQKNLYHLFNIEQQGFHCMEEICLTYTLHACKLGAYFLTPKHNYLICDACGQYPIPLSEKNVLYSPLDRESIGIVHLTWASKSFYYYPTQQRNADIDEHKRLFLFASLLKQSEEENRSIDKLKITDTQISASMHYRIWPD